MFALIAIKLKILMWFWSKVIQITVVLSAFFSKWPQSLSIFENSSDTSGQKTWDFCNFSHHQNLFFPIYPLPPPPFSMLFWQVTWTVGLKQHWKWGVGGYRLSTYINFGKNDPKIAKNLMFCGHWCLNVTLFGVSGISHIYDLNFYLCVMKILCYLNFKILEIQLFHTKNVGASQILWKNVIFGVYLYLK